MAITRYRDESPEVTGSEVRSRSQTYQSFQVPELGDDAALKMTQRALRTALKGIAHVDADPYMAHRSRVSRGDGSIKVLAKDRPDAYQEWDTAFPGGYVLVGESTYTIVPRGSFADTYETVTPEEKAS